MGRLSLSQIPIFCTADNLLEVWELGSWKVARMMHE